MTDPDDFPDGRDWIRVTLFFVLIALACFGLYELGVWTFWKLAAWG